MFPSVMLAIALASARAQVAPSSSPMPTPKSQCVAAPGRVKYCGDDIERYFVPSGPPKYLSLRRPAGAAVVQITGVISGYSVDSERAANIPISGVLFAPFNKRGYSPVFFAHPLMINGRRFECAVGKTASHFAQLFHLCPSLPASVLHAAHGVTMSIYTMVLPDGSFATVTDSINTIP